MTEDTQTPWPWPWPKTPTTADEHPDAVVPSKTVPDHPAEYWPFPTSPQQV